jgi:hypothetical protein
MGLIPLIYGFSSPKAQDIVAPSQAGLWSVLGEAESARVPLHFIS